MWLRTRVTDIPILPSESVSVLCLVSVSECYCKNKRLWRTGTDRLVRGDAARLHAQPQPPIAQLRSHTVADKVAGRVARSLSLRPSRLRVRALSGAPAHEDDWLARRVTRTRRHLGGAIVRALVGCSLPRRPGSSRPRASSGGTSPLSLPTVGDPHVRPPPPLCVRRVPVRRFHRTCACCRQKSSIASCRTCGLSNPGTASCRCRSWSALVSRSSCRSSA